MQTDFSVCASGDVFRPTGPNGQLAFNSYMANLYLWEDSTRLVGLRGQTLTPAASNEATPAATGSVFNISQPPENYAAVLEAILPDAAVPYFVDDAGNGHTYNPWDECVFTPSQPPNDLAKWLRRGSPWRLSFYENIDQTPHSVRFCDWPAGPHKGDPGTTPPGAPK
jgi:hypothetical protein